MRTRIYDAEYLLFPLTPRSEGAKYIVEGLKSGAFGILAEKGEFVVAKRGLPTDRNEAILKRLAH